MYGYGYSNSFKTGDSIALPVNTVAPAITGTATVGQTLSCSTGAWVGTLPLTYAYQWKRNNVAILGATSSTYTLVLADDTASIKCTITATNGAGSVSADSNTVTAALDTDAQAFITAATITDSTQKSAVNQLVVDMKNANIWSKMLAVYPFVGGTSTTHKWNLKDPRDLDAAYRLVFSGGLTHSSNGVLPNGTNGWANTYLTHNLTNFPTTKYISYSYYSRTSGRHGATQGNLLGAFSGASASCRMLVRFNNTDTSVSGMNYNDGVLPNARTLTDTDGTGLYLGTRSSTASKLFAKGVLLASNSDGTTNLNVTGLPLYLFSYNNNNSGPLWYTNKQCSFIHIGEGLSDSEVTSLTNAVNTFQTTLGRNV